jgi:hypothetical protein
MTTKNVFILLAFISAMVCYTSINFNINLILTITSFIFQIMFFTLALTWEEK